jgi:hypothetical protein
LTHYHIFFYRKKHEWFAVCFFDENFICRWIWIEKGHDRFSVTPKLFIEESINFSNHNGLKYAILAHNHPLSSLDLPKYGNYINASYEYKKQSLAFSRADKQLFENWKELCGINNIEISHSLFVAGEIKIAGNYKILNNYNLNKPFFRKFKGNKTTKNECFIATAIYGEEADQTVLLRNFRDIILLKYLLGQYSFKMYYKYSPPIAKKIKNSRLYTVLFTFLLNPVVYVIQTLFKNKW